MACFNFKVLTFWFSVVKTTELCTKASFFVVEGPFSLNHLIFFRKLEIFLEGGVHYHEKITLFVNMQRRCDIHYINVALVVGNIKTFTNLL